MQCYIEDRIADGSGSDLISALSLPSPRHAVCILVVSIQIDL